MYLSESYITLFLYNFLFSQILYLQDLITQTCVILNSRFSLLKKVKDVENYSQ